MTAQITPPVASPMVQPDQMLCKVCHESAIPIMGCLKTGQLGPCCAKCGAEQGIAIAGGQARGLGRDNDASSNIGQLPLAAAPPPVVPAPAPAAVPVARRAQPAPVPTREQLPLAEEWTDPEGTARTPQDVIVARLSAARLELARLQVDQCRMRGLEAEVKALEKTLSRVTTGAARPGVN